MAQPFISLGLKATNFLVDKHFDKVPDAALHPETYHPKNVVSKKHRRKAALKRKKKNDRARNSSSSSSSDNDNPSSEEAEETIVSEGAQNSQHGAPRSMFSPPQQPYFPPPPQQSYYPPPPQQPTYAQPQHQMNDGPPIYSHELPRLRPEYTPSPPPAASGYPYPTGAYAPPPFQPRTIDRKSRRDSYGDEDYYSDSYRSRPRRPKAVTRRSSSYHGPRSSTGGDRPSTTGSAHVDKAREKAHRYGLKDEFKGVFTQSKEGLAGGAVGALVGGWAAQKAQQATGRDKHAASPLLTVLGAALGGLAVNAVVEKYEESLENTNVLQAKWNEKFDRGADSDGGKSQKSQRSRRDRGSSRKDSKYDDDDDDDYGSDHESDEGQSHRSQRSRRARRESRGNMSDGYD